ncbi:mannosyltransferase family protein [Streptomyces sp. NPDC057116]|uniref:mannosyltransferase family protein n=1 Tax=Streptomyces sp. NPDC057116 TaxID=3346023 RepID=UPI00362C6144
MAQLPTRNTPDARGTAPSRRSPGGAARPGAAARITAAARRAWPALAAYAVARALGVAVILANSPKGLLDVLASRWDSAWYVLIAEEGYPATCARQGELCRYAFLPLYPTLIRGAAAVLPLSTRAAAWVIAVLASVMAAWGVYAVAERVAGRRTAVIAVVMWGIVPHAVVQSMAYTETLFTALAAWALYAVLTRRWITAAVLAVFAGLTRPTGVAVVAMVVACALWELRPGPGREERPVARLLTAAAVAPLGWCCWFAWVALRAGQWDGYLRVQRRWGTTFDGGAYTLRHLAAVFGQRAISLDKAVIAATIGASVVLLVVCVLQRRPAPLLVYAVSVLVITLGTTGYFNSKARFLLTDFVLLLPLAAPLARARPVIAWTVLAGAALMSSGYGSYLLTVSNHSP